MRRPHLVRLVCLAVLLAGCGSPTDFVAIDQPQRRHRAESTDPLPGPAAIAGTIAFSARIDSPTDGDIYTVDIQGQNLRRLTRSPANEYSPSWSPDGRRIAFRSAPSPDASEQNPSDIAVVSLDRSRGHIPDPRCHAGKLVTGLVAARRLDRLLLGGVGRLGLYLVPRPMNRERHPDLEGDAEYPAWSPDGQHLAFMSLGSREGLTSDDYDVYVVDADGRNMQQLTRSPGEDGWPAWSHDGTRIAYSHMDPAGAEYPRHGSRRPRRSHRHETPAMASRTTIQAGRRTMPSSPIRPIHRPSRQRPQAACSRSIPTDRACS